MCRFEKFCGLKVPKGLFRKKSPKRGANFKKSPKDFLEKSPQKGTNF